MDGRENRGNDRVQRPKLFACLFWEAKRGERREGERPLCSHFFQCVWLDYMLKLWIQNACVCIFLQIAVKSYNPLWERSDWENFIFAKCPLSSYTARLEGWGKDQGHLVRWNGVCLLLLGSEHSQGISWDLIAGISWDLVLGTSWDDLSGDLLGVSWSLGTTSHSSLRL